MLSNLERVPQMWRFPAQDLRETKRGDWQTSWTFGSPTFTATMQISHVFATLVALLFVAEGATPASIANLANPMASTDAHLKSVAGALTDLLKTNGTNQASNSSEIVKTIKDLLEKHMKGHVLANFNKSLQAIEDSKMEFVKCRKAYEIADPARFPSASLLQTNSTPWYEEYFKAYSQCKAGTENLNQALRRCKIRGVDSKPVKDRIWSYMDPDCNLMNCVEW